ncbi:MAG TPA: oligopeptide/dipeptide ABC transporter ATP-binding protein [Nordella sp.]|nr:oligopeptide/dipeptide ABC transporter ATP-binding protein [Nordella sp.]
MADPSPLVALSDLSKSFESRKGLFGEPRRMIAVNQVTLDIARGQVTGVVGESGCGKSTLARLVLRFLEATSGSVVFDGIDLLKQSHGDMRRLRRRMQMVFQDPYSSLDPRYAIADALLEPFKVQGIRLDAAQARRKVEALLAMVGLDAGLRSSHPHQLSGGQRQRIGIARALALDPDLVVLDEPTASLDVSIQAQIVTLLEKLKHELGLTYLFISHDLNLVRYFSDRIVVMYLGRIVEILPDPQAPPRHPYTQTLLDSTFAPDPAQRRDISKLTGEIPSPYNLPPGCAFAARCRQARPDCRNEPPALETRSDGHAVACFHPLI